MSDLVIVESPAKARTIERYLGAGYKVKASVGHVRDLPKKELGVDVEHGFEPKYVIIRGKGKVIEELRKLAKKADRVILATDPDREGEAIAWHVAEALGNDDPDRFQRVTFREITKSAVREAMKNPGVIDMAKVDAQQARRILDRLVGYGVSPFLWKPIRPGLSAGRVQTVALRLITEREDEIRAFDAEEYWSITAHLRKDDQDFDAKLHQIDDRKFTLGNETETTAAVTDIADRPFVVTEVKRRERRKNPYAPFTTSTLQQEASKRLRFSARRTMSNAQRLYEGVEIPGREASGLITYMRTDSTRVSKGAVDEARRWISSEYGDDYRASSPRLYGGSASAGAQEAHEAIRPTDPSLDPAQVEKYLEPDQFRLYELIWLRFVASQMAPAIYDTTTADFVIEGASGTTYRYRATGSIVKFPGFTRLYDEAREAGDSRSLGDVDPLPDLNEKDEAALKEIEPKQHFTQPPPRYSEASLVKELEAQGIGRPSTYASIISVLEDRGYVDLEQRRFFPTDLGEIVAKLLIRVFPRIFDVDFTSRMESELDKVEEGTADWRELLADFYPRLKERLDEGKDVSEDLLLEILSAEGEVCEKCGRPMIVKFNKYGQFLGCSGYPECKSTRPIAGEEPIEQFLGNDPVTGKQIHARKGPYGPYVERETAEGQKPERSSLPEGVRIDELEMETALKYLSLPRSLGKDDEGEEIVAGLGRYGPYVRRGKTFANLPDHDAMFAVGLDEAKKLIVEKEKGGGKEVIKELGKHPESGKELNLLAGRYGPYVTDGKTNASLPKNMEPEEVDLETAVEMIDRKAARGGRGGRKGGGKKKTTTKKKTTKKKTTTRKKS